MGLLVVVSAPCSADYMDNVVNRMCNAFQQVPKRSVTEALKAHKYHYKPAFFQLRKAVADKSA